MPPWRGCVSPTREHLGALDSKHAINNHNWKCSFSFAVSGWGKCFYLLKYNFVDQNNDSLQLLRHVRTWSTPAVRLNIIIKSISGTSMFPVYMMDVRVARLLNGDGIHKAQGSRQQQQAETPIWSSAFTWFTTLNPIERGWPATEIASAASFTIARNFFNINNMEAINVEKKLAFSQNSIWIIIWQFGLSACNKIFHFFPSSFRGRMRICLPDVSPARACIGFQFTKCLYTCTRTSRISVAFNRTRMQFQMHSNAIPDAFQTRGENLHLIISNREVGAVLL